MIDRRSRLRGVLIARRSVPLITGVQRARARAHLINYHRLATAANRAKIDARSGYSL